MSSNKLITSKDLQEMGFSRPKAFEILADPTLPVVRVGRRKYIRESDFEQWMKDRTVSTDSEVKKSNDRK